MKFHFDQYETEAKLNGVLRFGDEKQIAQRMGRSESLISQMCNPHDERASDFFKAAQFLAAFCDHSPERGREALQLFVRLVERHLPDDSIESHENAIRDFNAELKEFLDAAMCNRPADECLDELDDVIQTIHELRKTYRRKVVAVRAI